MGIGDEQSAATDRKLQRCTLVFPRRGNDAIFLARKARGFGTGKWVGFGGKAEPSETIDECALREFREETGSHLSMHQMKKIALLLFTFECEPNYFLEVHVYETFDMVESPVLCDEFHGKGTWYERGQIPFAEMWPDFQIWSDLVFSGQRFIGRIAYGDFKTIRSSRLIHVEEANMLQAESGWE